MAQPSDHPAQYSTRLEAIADTLGIAVDQFCPEKAPPFVVDVLDLVRLYAAIDDAQGRQRVLNVVRREATRGQVLDGPVPPVG